jgi:hypothetical protein
MIVYSNLHATNLVKAGIQWANTKFGPEWVWKIDPAKLNIGDGHSCFFGQAYAHEAKAAGYVDGWHYAVSSRIIAWETAYELGFSVKYRPGGSDEWTTNVRTLNAAWRAQIAMLRQSVPQPTTV